jgi:hypothetical protein
LLTREEKIALLEENGTLSKSLEAHPEDLWIKDYYASRID